MKRDISDLLDCYREEHIDLDPVTPLSPSRVKELTMNRIKPKQPHSPRIRMRMLAIAAAIALLSLTALAAGSLGGRRDLLFHLFRPGQRRSDYWAGGDHGPHRPDL